MSILKDLRSIAESLGRLVELAEAEPLDVPFTVEKEPAYLNKEQPNVQDSNPNS